MDLNNGTAEKDRIFLLMFIVCLMQYNYSSIYIMNILHVFFGLLMTVLACDAYKILVIFPLPGKSHGILGGSIVNALLDAGHEVTYIQGIPFERSHPNLTNILLKEQDDGSFSDHLSFESILNQKFDYSTLMGLGMTVGFAQMFGEHLENGQIQELMRDPNQKFDLVFIEWLFNDFMSMIPAAFECPLIWYSSVEPHWQVTRLVDEALSPAYNTDTFTSATVPFSFYERAQQLFLQTLGHIFVKIAIILDGRLYNRAVVPILEERGRPVPDYVDLVYNASMILSNTHVSLGKPIRLPQNFKHIGGHHISTEVKPLPKDLQILLDNAKDGLIYFSMGSNLKSKTIPKVLKDDLLKMFSQFKQTVLWKLEEDLPNLPKNVHIVHWAPQPSILAHPNTVLFITHGGLLSTTEATHFGVPMIGIPIFADQFSNIDKAVNRGFAKRVELSYSMADSLRDAIQEIVSNPKYMEKAKEWSFIYHDRPIHPVKEMVHWVEHVIKTKGAPHLRSPALLVPWYQQLYLDLLVVLVIVIHVLVKAFRVLRFFYRQYRIPSHEIKTKSKTQ